MMKRLNALLRRARRSAPARNDEGFSLVEILMVLMILTVGIIPLAVIQHHSRKEVIEADIYSRSMNLAQAEMERVKGLGFGNALSDSGTVDNIQWVVRVNNAGFGLERIEVSTTWTGGGGAQTITLVDMMSMR